MVDTREMNLLVTGGTGFFGKALLKYWKQLPVWQLPSSITLISRNPEKFRAENEVLLEGLPISLVLGDVLKPETLPRGPFTHVLHAATDSTYGPKLPPLERYMQIVRGTENILELTRSVGVKRFMLTSSGAVYGRIPSEMTHIPEEYEGPLGSINLQTVYAHAKRHAEYLTALHADAYGFEYVIARCFAFIGEDLPLDVHFAAGNFIRAAVTSDEIVIFGDGKSVRSYMYQFDLAMWLNEMLTHAPSGEIFNVGSSEAVSMNELAQSIFRALGKSPKIKIMGEKIIGTGGNYYVPNVTKAEKILGLRNSKLLDESIGCTLTKIGIKR